MTGPPARRDRSRRRAGRRLLALVGPALSVWTACLSGHAAELPPARVLDDFGEPAAWTAVASDGVQASVHPSAGARGRGLRLDFDLGGTAGYALARRALPLELPANYEISFHVRADAPVNHFQVKFVDATGENVWWVNRPDFEFPREWQRMRIRKRHVEFAWGPGRDRTLRHAASIEFAVAAGRGGGGGSVYVSDLTLRPLPEETAGDPPPVVRASSSLAGSDASLALDDLVATAWRSERAAGRAQTLTVDFQRPREFGGVAVRWLAHAYASRYDVQFSDDGARWRTVRRIVGGRGGWDPVRLPEAETRFLRLALHDGPDGAYGIAELEIKDHAFGASPNAFFRTLAREAPRGTYPRGMSGEQTAWTVVGVDGGGETGLLSEDGALEVSKGGFSIEPFVVTESGVVGWADVVARQSLLDGYLPIPGVTWRQDQWELRVSAFASGSRPASRLVARYELGNRTGQALPLQLVLAVRPFQVNPPSQTLNTVGGASPIAHVRWDGHALSVAGRTVFPLRGPDAVGAFPFDAGPVPWRERNASGAGSPEVHDEAGYASAALRYRLTVEPHASATIGVVVTLSGSSIAPDLAGERSESWLERQETAVAEAWRARLDRVSIRGPAVAQPLIDSLRTALAHILITRDGPMLRPGARSYARSWIRDGAMMAESLLRLGHGDVAADYLRWYAPYQFASGKVPCCVDERGADPVPEHDSAGELIFLAAETYRYTRDRGLLQAMWPHVEAAARYLDILRRSERTEANLSPVTRAFYGLLPASISHEGYSAKPMHSYWDDFWALKGYTGGITIAHTLGHAEAARRLEQSRAEFRQDLLASLGHAAAAHGIAYLPGSAELGDFDPTSTTIAIAPRGELHRLPLALVLGTYDRYWREFVERRDGRRAWEDYTPYEIRTVGTFVRLGWRERAHELLAFFLGDRWPVAWNQWPEVVGRDARQPRFVGDLPHGWVASDFIRAALDLFAYERERDEALVLAAGVPAGWLEGPGVAVKELRTPYGRLTYSLRRDENGDVVLDVAGGLQTPPGGLVLTWPGVGAPTTDTRLNGRIVRWDGTELRFHELPARVIVRGGS